MQHTQMIPDGTPPTPPNFTSSGRTIRRKGQQPSAPPPPPPSLVSSRSHSPTNYEGQIDTSAPIGHDSRQELGPVEMNEVDNICVLSCMIIAYILNENGLEII